MRDLRANVRTFSEPILVMINTEEVVDGVVSEGIAVEYKEYANVFESRNNGYNNTTEASINNNEIVVQVRRNSGYEIKQDSTTLFVRGEEYIVRESKKFGLNQETITLTCVLKND